MARIGFQNTDKAARIVRDAGGRIVGRTRLQKTAYLLEVTRLGEGFQFEYRHYGPYSEELADAVSTASLAGIIAEEERTTTWGGSYSIFTAAPDPQSTASIERNQIIALAQRADPIALELAATAVFLASKGEKKAWDETVRRKPEKAGKLDQAKNLFRELKSVQTPTPLPDL